MFIGNDANMEEQGVWRSFLLEVYYHCTKKLPEKYLSQDVMGMSF